MKLLKSALVSLSVFGFLAPALGQAAVDYTYKTFDYSTWKDGDEKNVLNLFPGFQPAKNSGELVVFLSQSRSIVSKPENQINLENALKLENLRKIKDGIVNLTVVTPQDLRSNKEQYLAYKNPKEAWCSRPTDLCVESEFVFRTTEKVLINLAMRMAGKTDKDIRAQSQVRINRGNDIAGADAIKRLTGINTPVSAVMTEDLFWFSHLMEYGKILGVVQQDPSNPSQTIITTFTVFAVDKKWWDRGPTSDYKLSEVFLGKRGNGTSGLSMGLPKLTQQLFSKLLNEI